MDQPTGFPDALRLLAATKAMVENLGFVAGQAYATNRFRAQPVVSHHFTRGNVQRYGWAVLKEATLEQKAGGAKASNLASKAAGRRTTGADKTQGVGTLPALVRSGKMRNTIETMAKVIRHDAEHTRCEWQVEPYMAWHHTGGTTPGRPPKRSPIEPNEADIEEVVDIVQAYVDQSIGDGRISFRPPTA